MQHNVSGAPHTFPLCITCWRENDPLARADMVHFSLSCSVACVLKIYFCISQEGGHWFAEFETFEAYWATPPSLVHIKAMAPGMEIRSQRAGLLSNYVIDRALFPLHLLSGMIPTDKNFEWFTEQTMASWEILYMFLWLRPCWSMLMNNEPIQYYLVWCMVASASFAALG